MNLILASTSKYRKELLNKLNVDFNAIDPCLDESTFKNRGLGPVELAELLSKEKALAARNIQQTGIILGGDQVAELNGEILDKPGSRENAFSQLKKMQGHTHKLITSFCLLLEDGKSILNTDITKLKMKKLNDDQINWYLDKDEPYDCAGSYKLESYGISLFEKIESEDQTAIMGLPLLKLSMELNGLGISNP
jgi:septum formation protein